MSIRNRELSQFGSFIYIDDSTKSVGITTTDSPNVGIGTTNSTHKLTVVGDTNLDGNANISGIVSATSYYLNGNQLVDVDVLTWGISDSDIYRLSGNVGIGSTIPQAKLDIIGDIRITGSISGRNVSLSNASGIVTSSQFDSTATTGTAPFIVASQTLVTNLNADYLRGKIPPSGDIVGTTDSQNLTNKTLTSPTFGSSGVVFSGSTSGVTTVRANSTATGIVVIPSVTGIQTFVTTNTVGLITSGMIADLSIANVDVAVGAAISYSKLNLLNSITNADIASGAAIAISKLTASTISGISLGNNLNNLTAGSYINYSSGSTYNGSSAITISVAATTLNTANTIVARDSSGDFSAGTISCANLNSTFNLRGDLLIVNRISAGSTVGIAGSILSSTGSGIQWIEPPGGFSVTNDTSTDSSYYPVFVNATTGKPSQTSVSSTKLQFNPSTGNFSATQFTSLSDATQKTNIKPIENPIDLVKQLNAVKFNWIDNNKPSIGVIAQEVEKVLPELVLPTSALAPSYELKTVNYDGLIGVLIEAIKEQQTRIEELERKLNV